MPVELRQWLARNWFWVALLLVIFAGYQVGKDFAQRENARDRIMNPENAWNNAVNMKEPNNA